MSMSIRFCIEWRFKFRAILRSVRSRDCFVVRCNEALRDYFSNVL